MKNINNNDERIVSQRRKIQSDACQILIWCLLISVLFQQFILRVPFSQFAAEFFCVIGIGIYMAIRHLTIGVNIWNDNTESKSSKKIVINGLLSGIIFMVIYCVLTGEGDVLKLLTAFICYAAAYIGINLFFSLVVKRKQTKMDIEFDNEDEGDEN